MKKKKNALTMTINYPSWRQHKPTRNFYHIFSSEWHSNAMFNHAVVAFTVARFCSSLYIFFSSSSSISDFRAIRHFFHEFFFPPTLIYLFTFLCVWVCVYCVCVSYGSTFVWSLSRSLAFFLAHSFAHLPAECFKVVFVFNALHQQTK